MQCTRARTLHRPRLCQQSGAAYALSASRAKESEGNAHHVLSAIVAVVAAFVAGLSSAESAPGAPERSTGTPSTPLGVADTLASSPP